MYPNGEALNSDLRQLLTIRLVLICLPLQPRRRSSASGGSAAKVS